MHVDGINKTSIFKFENIVRSFLKQRNVLNFENQLCRLVHKRIFHFIVFLKLSRLTINNTFHKKLNLNNIYITYF
jgi:hypothetical protein